MTTSAEVRSQLVKALQLDLIGPSAENTDSQHEILPQSPTSWYLSGFLAPSEAPPHFRSDDTADDELDQITGNSTGEDETTPEKTAARKGFFPVSMGLSFLLSQNTKIFDVMIEWGDYIPEPSEEEETEE